MLARGVGVLALSLLCLLTGCHRLNTGAYANNYIMVVGSNADFLIHPTGEYKSPESVRDAGYQPTYRKVDDMEQAVADMREKGYVMIGYSAVNTRERGEKPCDEKALGFQALQDCRMNYAITHRISPDADTLGTPYDAAIWANADTVLVQQNYSFTRQEVQQRRIVTDEGVDVSRSSGQTRGSHHDNWRSSTYGTSNTKGEGTSSGSFNQDSKEAHADVGAAFGSPTANIGGSIGNTKGTNKNKNQYGEQTNSQSRSSGSSRGGSQEAFDTTVQHSTKHWATALVDKHVDHYDIMATFWKKADVKKMILGAITEPVPRDKWGELGTRGARVVIAVVGGTPAYYAEIWEGDILIAINGEKVLGEAGYGKLLDKYQGQEITITLWRNGNFYDVTVPLNA